MQSFKIWILFKGYVIIRVDGANIERFINICVHKELTLLDVKRKDGFVILKMPAHGFKFTRLIAKKTGCKVKILEKKGFSFFFKKYKKRKSFAIGIMVFLTTFALLWSYIWEIELTGDSCLKRNDVVKYLGKNNIRIGSVKYFLDTKKIEDDFILNFKNLAWVDVKIKGTKLVIDVVDRKKVPDIINKNLPCDIVAKKDGIIEEVLVKNGVEVVKVGDVVLKGDILISGIIDLEFFETKMVHAIGNVKARTSYEKVEEVNLLKVKKNYTGRTSSRYIVEFLNKDLFKLKFGEEYNNYDKIDSVMNFKLFKNFIIPLKIKKEKRSYYYKNQEVLSMDIAKKEAFNKALSGILKGLSKDASITKQNVDYFERDGKIFVKVIVETCEDIGIEKAIE